MTPGRTPDEGALALSLREELGRHEPDLAHIQRRVHRGMAEGARAPRLRMRGLTGWAAVAGTATLVVAVMVVGSLLLPPTSEPDAPPAAPVSTTDPDPTDRLGELSVVVVPADETTVALAGTALLDYVVAGVDSEDPFVVARRDGGEQPLSTGAVGNPQSTVPPGPFTVEWRGAAAPFPSGATGRWFLVEPTPGGPDSGVLVRVATVPREARALVVHAGVGGTDGQVTVLLDGRPAATAAIPAEGPAMAPYRLDVPLAGTEGSELEVRVLVPDGGTAGLATAELRGPAAAAATSDGS